MEYKSPADVLTYSVNFTNELGGAGIASRSVTVPVGITKDSDSINADNVDITLSGGTKGETYKIDVNITTTSSDDFTKSFFVRVRDEIL